MYSDLFGSGVPKFLDGEDVISIEKSFIEAIELESRDIEHESIINATRNWIDIVEHNHLNVTVLCRLHKQTTNALTWFKNFYNTYNKTEIDALSPSQNADYFVDEDGEFVKFRMQITELFPLETPWAYDSFRMIFKSKKPVNLGSLQVYYAQIAPSDSTGLLPSDTDKVIPTD